MLHCKCENFRGWQDFNTWMLRWHSKMHEYMTFDGTSVYCILFSIDPAFANVQDTYDATCTQSVPSWMPLHWTGTTSRMQPFLCYIHIAASVRATKGVVRAKNIAHILHIITDTTKRMFLNHPPARGRSKGENLRTPLFHVGLGSNHQLCFPQMQIKAICHFSHCIRAKCSKISIPILTFSWSSQDSFQILPLIIRIFSFCLLISWCCWYTVMCRHTFLSPFCELTGHLHCQHIACNAAAVSVAASSTTLLLDPYKINVQVPLYSSAYQFPHSDGYFSSVCVEAERLLRVTIVASEQISVGKTLRKLFGNVHLPASFMISACTLIDSPVVDISLLAAFWSWVLVCRCAWGGLRWCVCAAFWFCYAGTYSASHRVEVWSIYGLTERNPSQCWHRFLWTSSTAESGAPMTLRMIFTTEKFLYQTVIQFVRVI